MTPSQFYAIVKQATDDILKAIKAAYDNLLRLLRGGTPPQQAVDSVTNALNGDIKQIMAASITAITGQAVQNIDSYMVGNVSLSSRLYSQSVKTSTTVQTVVQRHVKGFQDAKSLALQIYQGYGFNPPADLLKIFPDNPALPKYLREALLPDSAVQRAISTAFAKSQAKALKTGALKAAYSELIKAIDSTAAGPGDKYLATKLQVAFEEKMRYYAKRIAVTELSRVYAAQQAKDLLADPAVQYVQWVLNPAHPITDICDYFANVDKYGLGKGVYPKALAPVQPAHPHCMCVLNARFDLTGKQPKSVPDADIKLLSQYSAVDQRKIAGSKKKLQRIKAGEDAWKVHNSTIDPLYQVKQASSI